ncbi:MAG: SMP-30/gluconolactonase/LRE family protein [Micrococcales bacterium]|nr:SMP-30/gluconolactonase/LRE family protein [Micrococcales bacterium]
MTSIENVTGPIAYHAEGPVWHESYGGLRYVDLYAGDLITLTDSGPVRRHVGDIAAFHRPRTAGGFVVALRDRLALADSDDGELRLLDPLEMAEGERFNDGTASPAGTLYGGTIGRNAEEGAATLYRFGADGTPEPLLTGVTVSNGIGFSPDGTRAYYNDTPTDRITVFDNEDDRLVRPRPLAQVEGDGMPDGLTVDAEGGVWVALWGGSAVRRYSPDGELTAEIALPVSQVSALTFGGPDLATLFITTSRESLPDGQEPDAGSVYAARPGVRGLPVLPTAL